MIYFEELTKLFEEYVKYIKEQAYLGKKVLKLKIFKNKKTQRRNFAKKIILYEFIKSFIQKKEYVLFKLVLNDVYLVII